MAFGSHWEWRGFGPVSPSVRQSIEALPRKFPTPHRVTDRYLWVPGSSLNIKLREGAFKIKRCLAAFDGAAEKWVEDERENYVLPLAGSTVAGVLEDIGLRPPDVLPSIVADAEALLELFRHAEPAARWLDVAKVRWQFDAPPTGSVIVELAAITVPERVESVGVEDPERANVVAATALLGLPGSLRTMSYVDALAVWARGGALTHR